MENNHHSNQEADTITLSGAVASPGIVLGKAFIYQRKNPEVKNTSITDSQTDKHWQRFEKAREVLEEELGRLLQKNFSQDVKEIINAQIEIVNDPDLARKVHHIIYQDHSSAGYAIQEAFEGYLELLSVSNEYAGRHSIDVTDIRDRLIQVVQDNYSITEITSEHVLVAEELSPREVIKLAGKEIKAIVIDNGGTTSHAAIIARSMGIPTVVGTREACAHLNNGELIGIDAEKGTVVIRPDSKTIEKFKSREQRYRKAVESWKEMYEQPSETRDGEPFTLRANLEFAEELPLVKTTKAEGIGLLRTESIYLGEEDFDNIDRQQNMYEHILSETGDHPVTIRLFDAGGDKLFPTSPHEQNPFLGWRGIRLLLDEKDLLCGQLEAILKTAGNHPGRVRLLLPMITDLDELQEIHSNIDEVTEKIKKEGHPVDNQLQVGIMVEVPAVALMIDYFVDYADFFSIGTNDLTQYILAADRGNERVRNIYDQHHPAVWKLIKKVADAGKKWDKEISVCGELASDPVAAVCLIGIGIHELSMSPGRLGAVKAMLVDKKMSEMQKQAKEVLACTSKKEVAALFKKWNEKS